MNVCLSIHAPKVRVPETLLGRPRALIAFVTAVDNRGVHSFSLSLSLSLSAYAYGGGSINTHAHGINEW